MKLVIKNYGNLFQKEDQIKSFVPWVLLEVQKFHVGLGLRIKNSAETDSLKILIPFHGVHQSRLEESHDSQQAR